MDHDHDPADRPEDALISALYREAEQAQLARAQVAQPGGRARHQTDPPPGHVFISHGHDSEDYVARLAEHLSEASIPVWRDSEIDQGAQWESVVTSMINTCSALLVVMTPAAETSDRVAREVTQARDIAKPVFTLLLAGKASNMIGDLQSEDVTRHQMPGTDLLRRLSQLIGQQKPLIEIQSASIQGDQAELVVMFGRAFAFYHVFLDTDGDSSTGYRIPDRHFGANYMIENGHLWRARSYFWEWQQVAEVKALFTVADQTYRWRLPLSILGMPPGAVLRALAHGAQDSGRHDVYSPIVTAHR